MADYWMKLYIEILDDPKMATLPDRIWRRIIELFLVAKREGKDGHLPETRQLAWILRMNTEELESDLSQIVKTGIIAKEESGWFVTKFAQRQAPATPKERKQQERKRNQSQQYYGNVTDQSRIVTQSTEAESEAEADNDSFPHPLSVAFEKASGIAAYDPPKWIPAIKRMQELGITDSDIKIAIDELRRKSYNILGPWSVVNAAINVHGKRNGNQPEQVYRVIN